MAKDWGLKITKPGQATTTTNPTKMLFSSAYQMFKYHQDSTATITIAPNGTYGTAEVTHGLGYVPAFIPYMYNGIQDDMAIVPAMPYGIGYSAWSSAWADTNKIYFRYDLTYTWNTRNVNSVDWFQNFGGDSYTSVQIGKPSGSTAAESAIAFDNVYTTAPGTGNTETVTKAEIVLKVASKNETTSGRIKWRTRGVDEDDCNDFNNNNPMGKSSTDAYVDKNIQTAAEVSVDGTVSWDVTNIFNEIKSRGGWSSGNAMAFLFNDIGSDNDNSFRTYAYSTTGNYLKVTYSSSLVINFRALIFKDQIA